MNAPVFRHVSEEKSNEGVREGALLVSQGPKHRDLYDGTPSDSWINSRAREKTEKGKFSPIENLTKLGSHHNSQK